MKYDGQLAGIKSNFPNAKNILISLPQEPTVDELAAGLAFYLSLKQSGKTASIVTEGTIRVGHTNLFGVGEIQDKLPQSQGGDFVLVLKNVATPGPDGKGVVSSVEKMDYFTNGNDLNLVFKVFPGQKFEPTQITSTHEGGSFDLIFVLGASSLNDLGSVYTNNQAIFNTQIVNIDNSQANANFGTTNVVDSTASSVCEIVGDILPSLQLPFDGDIATNIVSGIFEATNGLQNPNVGADTYAVVSQALRSGGQKPAAANPVPQAQASVPQSNPVDFDLSKVFNQPINPPAENFTVPQVVEPATTASEQPSPEEAPSGESAATPEADWLTPKIYKGSSLG